MRDKQDSSEINALVGRCLQGEERAWEELDRLYRRKTRSHVVSILKQYHCLSMLDEHLESIVSYIFEELFIYLKCYNFTEFDAWFYRLRFSKTLDYIRRELRHTSRLVAVEEIDSFGSAPGGGGGERAVLRRQMGALIDQLEVRYALPLKMFYFEGLTYREIAGVLEINAFAVGMRIMRAKRQLREKIEAAEDPSEEAPRRGRPAAKGASKKK